MSDTREQREANEIDRELARLADRCDQGNPYGRGDKDWAEARRLINCARNHVRRRMSERTRQETRHG